MKSRNENNRMNKYRNRKVVRDGMTFDSEKEYRRWCELYLLQRAGKISYLRRQEKFILIQEQRELSNEIYQIGPKKGRFKPGKIIERECAYIADFTYLDEDGKLVVEDVKGYKRGGAYSVFAIKRKLMLKEFGIRVKEV